MITEKMLKLLVLRSMLDNGINTSKYDLDNIIKDYNALEDEFLQSYVIAKSPVKEK